MIIMGPKKIATVIVSRHLNHGDDHEKEPEGGDDEGLRSAAEDLIAGIKQDEPEMVMQALKAAFDLCNSEPEEEGPTEEGGE